MEAALWAQQAGLFVCEVWKIHAMQWDFSPLHYLEHPKNSVVTPTESSTMKPRSHWGRVTVALLPLTDGCSTAKMVKTLPNTALRKSKASKSATQVSQGHNKPYIYTTLESNTWYSVPLNISRTQTEQNSFPPSTLRLQETFIITIVTSYLVCSRINLIGFHDKLMWLYTQGSWTGHKWALDNSVTLKFRC